MTIQDIIAQVDDLTPNACSAEQKLRWLTDLDGRIYRELILAHEGAERVCPPAEEGCGDEEELLVPPPYGGDLYRFYLQSRIAAENGEIRKYSQFSALFNRAWADYAAWYGRTHMPLPRGRWRL